MLNICFPRNVGCTPKLTNYKEIKVVNGTRKKPTGRLMKESNFNGVTT